MSGYVRPMYSLHCDLGGLPRANDKSYAIMLLYDGFTKQIYEMPLAKEKAGYVIKSV